MTGYGPAVHEPDERAAIELVLERIAHDGPVSYGEPLVGGLVELVRRTGTDVVGWNTDQLRDYLQFLLAALDIDEVEQ